MADVALFLHLLGVIVFTAGIALAGAAFEYARCRERASEIAAMLALTRVGVALVACGGLMVLGAGLWLVHLEHLGYSTGWILAALVMYLIALLLGALGGQKPKRARRLATELAVRNALTTEQLRTLLDDRISRIANYTSASLVLGILALMVFKP